MVEMVFEIFAIDYQIVIYQKSINIQLTIFQISRSKFCF